MATQNAINNTILNNNFTVPNGSITASGNIISSAGNINATTGQVNAGTTMTAGTGITATTGNITATAGNVVITAGNLTLPDTNTGGTQGRIVFGGSTYIQDYPAGSANFMAGFLAGNTAGTLTGQGNNGIGGGVFSMLTSGASNTALGHVALQVVNTGSQNVAIGAGCFNLVTSGANNTGLGYQTAQFLATGSNNLLLGTSSGSAYIGAESNNIILANAGVAAENAKIRIGTNATHTAAYVAGIDGVNVGSTAKVVTLGTGGTVDQLGTATITAGTGITITPGANTITLAAAGGGITWAVTTVNASIVVNNGYIANKAGLLTMTLPATAIIGDIIEITGINTAVGWRIAQNANQRIHISTLSTTIGAGGYIEATAIRDSVKLVCVVAGASTEYNVLSVVGNITVV